MACVTVLRNVILKIQKSIGYVERHNRMQRSFRYAAVFLHLREENFDRYHSGACPVNVYYGSISKRRYMLYLLGMLQCFYRQRLFQLQWFHLRTEAILKKCLYSAPGRLKPYMVTTVYG